MTNQFVQPDAIDIICGRAPVSCGFRVDAGYYQRKPKFAVQICARCNGPIRFVEHGTETDVPALGMVNDGRVMKVVEGASLVAVSVAAATAVVDYNLLQSHPDRSSMRPRRIKTGGLAGSAAALDTLVRILVGATRVADLYNQATGAPSALASMFEIGASVPAGVEVSAIVVDAPATNPINLALDIA